MSKWKMLLAFLVKEMEDFKNEKHKNIRNDQQWTD